MTYPRPCDVFTGHVDKNGYGKEYNPLTKRSAGAHRLAYERHHNVVLTPDQLVRHTCDNPPCREPTHLVLGTQAQNMADMMSRGRLGRRLGSSNNQATVDDDTVQLVRRLYTGKHGEQTALGKRFGVSRVTISNWVKGYYR